MTGFAVFQFVTDSVFLLSRLTLCHPLSFYHVQIRVMAGAKEEVTGAATRWLGRSRKGKAVKD
jgi:hypothetical protein